MYKSINAETRRACSASAPAAGFSLVEVAVALGIVAFVLVVLIGLAGTALRSTGESSKSIEAANAASQIVARWRSILEWNTRPGNATLASQPAGFPVSIDIPQAGQSHSGADIFINGEGDVVSSDQKFRVDYKVERSDKTPGMVRLYLRLSWPPQAAAASGRSSYEIVTGILLGTT